MKNFEELKALLAEPKKIVLLPHRNPDGDAIGSTLVMSRYLSKLGHECDIIAPNDFPKFLKWMDGAKGIHIAEYGPQKSRILVEKAQLIFMLDFNTLDRIDEVGDWVKRSKAPRVMIDHHEEPIEVEFMYSDPDMPSTCQMVYNFIEKMGHTDMIDVPMGECLFTGIVTDTGSFRYPSTKPSSHDIVARLMEIGVDTSKVYNNVYDTQSVDRLKLLSVVLDSLEVHPEHRSVIMNLTRQQQQDHNTQKGDTEGVVNYGLRLQDYVFSTIFIEDQKHDFIKISFRSKGDFDVNAFARKHFNGGGHVNAAGGRSDLPMEETLQKFRDLLDEYKEELQKTEI